MVRRLVRPLQAAAEELEYCGRKILAGGKSKPSSTAPRSIYQIAQGDPAQKYQPYLGGVSWHSLSGSRVTSGALHAWSNNICDQPVSSISEADVSEEMLG